MDLTEIVIVPDAAFPHLSFRDTSQETEAVMKLHKILAIVGLSAASAAILTACRGGGTKDSPNPPQAEEPAYDPDEDIVELYGPMPGEEDPIDEPLPEETEEYDPVDIQPLVYGPAPE